MRSINLTALVALAISVSCVAVQANPSARNQALGWRDRPTMDFADYFDSFNRPYINRNNPTCAAWGHQIWPCVPQVR
jgi:hypothetical protein